LKEEAAVNFKRERKRGEKIAMADDELAQLRARRMAEMQAVRVLKLATEEKRERNESVRRESVRRDYGKRRR
jgi:hypothetical protein